MRSSTVLALLGATLAVASPVHQALHANHAKKAYAYDIVTDVVYVTITEGELPSTSSISATTVVISHTVYVNPVEESSKPPHTSSSSTYVPPPPPSSTYVPPPPPTTTSEPPPPPPTTTQAPAPAPTTTEAAPVVVTTQEAAAAPPASSDPLVSAAVSNHNTCRSSHSAPAVTYNATLAQWAANTASTCVFAHDMTQGTAAYGQNIAAQGSSSANAWTAETAVENAIISEWYSEESLFSSLYNQASPSGSGDFLHFTQIVWVGSTEIGCAVQACPTSNSIFPGDYTWFTVCNYFPQGNVEGEFNTNVLAS